MCAIRVPFDPKAVFGKTRAPVKVTLNGYSFRSTIASMGGEVFVPLRASHREAAGLDGTETLQVRLELDTEPRVVTPPADLEKALKHSPAVWEKWKALSFTHQREYSDAVLEAKTPETRARRIEKCLVELRTKNEERRTKN
jgi:Bacteriocin-protection, YdeI or OmpD-Associated/Domain of unknown function (DUF1905)